MRRRAQEGKTNVMSEDEVKEPVRSLLLLSSTPGREDVS
jgi:hypothetical protein